MHRGAGADLGQYALQAEPQAQPADQYAVEGRAVTLSVLAAGSPLLQYQWFKNGSAIAGATNALYVIAFPGLTNAGEYYANVRNPASSTNSRTATLAVLRDTLSPTVVSVAAHSGQVIVKFSEPVDSSSANNALHYGLSGGVGVSSALVNPGDSTQVTLTTGAPLAFGTVYTLAINGVTDLFGNASHTTAAFARGITIDGDFSDWQGLTPVYSGPIGTDGGADFKDIYVYNDAAKYYFRLTLWHDIPPGAGQFPSYVNMFFNTDNDDTTGYSAIGSELLIQSGYCYQEKNGGFNEGQFGSPGWFCLPASAGTNFEFSVSRTATFPSDGTLVFPTNALSFLFQGMTPAFAPINQAPAAGGVISFTNAAPLNVPALPVGQIAISGLPGGKVALVWDPPGTLQYCGQLPAGSWTNLPSATSPYVIPATGAHQFFRLAR